jgi:hypothetical protein
MKTSRKPNVASRPSGLKRLKLGLAVISMPMDFLANIASLHLPVETETKGALTKSVN